ncbi:MAG TPA: hypothetical protein VHN77_03155 [Phycisphaerales bacterium]|nr:hypothetical protein [Phycisphaerales bacterium]
MLEELHRHRQHHTGQINAVNMAATVGLSGLALTIILADKVPVARTGPYHGWLAWSAYGALCLGAVVLFVAAGGHWQFHADRVRKIDQLMCEYMRGMYSDTDVKKMLALQKVRGDPVASGLGNQHYWMYVAAAVGLGLMAVSALVFLGLKIAG